MRIFSAKGTAPPVIAAAGIYGRRHDVGIEVEVCGQQCARGDGSPAHDRHGFVFEVTQGNYDLAVAGSEADMDDLEMTGVVAGGSRRSLGLRETAILVPAENPGNIEGLQDLRRPGIAIAVSTIDCLRAAWEDVTGRAGVIEEIRKNITRRVTGCMALIETIAQGKADAAFGWSSFVHFHPNIIAIPLPAEYRIYRSTCVSILKGARDPLAAGSFADFLCSHEGREIFRQRGWIYEVGRGRPAETKGEDL